jgi:hypothetical protein
MNKNNFCHQAVTRFIGDFPFSPDPRHGHETTPEKRYLAIPVSLVNKEHRIM